jgi:hypothetical protein
VDKRAEWNEKIQMKKQNSLARMARAIIVQLRRDLRAGGEKERNA